ncbi:MAG: hypothetical protein K8R60_20325 [Burkholderiales bacterium]|nr:hypothetical protein [Burkholderiales bacterium]
MRLSLSPASRRFLVWLLACLVPLQALAAGVLAATGPAHTHLPAASARLVLDDLRRAPVRRLAVETHVASAFGHLHGGDAARHHHAASDASVVIDAAGLVQAGDGDDMSTSPSLGVFVGLISAPPGWLAQATTEPPAAHARWTPQTHHPALPERPPRAG